MYSKECKEFQNIHTRMLLQSPLSKWTLHMQVSFYHKPPQHISLSSHKYTMKHQIISQDSFSIVKNKNAHQDVLSHAKITIKYNFQKTYKYYHAIIHQLHSKHSDICLGNDSELIILTVTGFPQPDTGETRNTHKRQKMAPKTTQLGVPIIKHLVLRPNSHPYTTPIIFS